VLLEARARLVANCQCSGREHLRVAARIRRSRKLTADSKGQIVKTPIKPGGSDNGWNVNFAESEVNVISTGEARGGSVERGAESVESIPQPRLCAICQSELSRRQRVVCSRSCRARRGHQLHPQQGDGNHNFKGWRSRHPVLYTSQFKLRNPEKVRAHHTVAAAIRTGRLIRPGVCSVCLKVCRPDGHHADYAKPLSVEWLCRGCHVDRHRPQQPSSPSVSSVYA